jgi:hypothetical protein
MHCDWLMTLLSDSLFDKKQNTFREQDGAFARCIFEIYWMFLAVVAIKNRSITLYSILSII